MMNDLHKLNKEIEKLKKGLFEVARRVDEVDNILTQFIQLNTNNSEVKKICEKRIKMFKRQYPNHPQSKK